MVLKSAFTFYFVQLMCKMSSGTSGYIYKLTEFDDYTNTIIFSCHNIKKNFILHPELFRLISNQYYIT